MKKSKISEEVAKQQLQIFYDYYDFDTDEDVIDEDVSAGIKLSERKLIRAIKSGKLQIQEKDGSLEVIQTLKKGEELKYKELDGQCKIESDKHKGGNTKLLGIAGYLNELGLDGIKKLKGTDLSIAECLGVLFLQI